MLQIEVIGNLGKDAEVKEFSGKKYVCFSVAHTENVRAQKPGEPPTQRTTWLSIYWYGDGGAMLQYLKRGAKVFVRGTMRNNLYTDRTGQTRVDINVNAREVYLCGSSPTQPATQSAVHPQQPATTAQSVAATQHVTGQASPAGAPAPIGGEDDLPFEPPPRINGSKQRNESPQPARKDHGGIPRGRGQPQQPNRRGAVLPRRDGGHRDLSDPVRVRRNTTKRWNGR